MVFPDVPTIAEFVPGYEASAWFGFGAPRNTPAEIVGKVNKEVNAGLGDPKLQARLAEFGALPLVGSASGKFSEPLMRFALGDVRDHVG